MIYLIAFASIASAANVRLHRSRTAFSRTELSGDRAIRVRQQRYGLFPTLAWLNSSDRFLIAMVWSGIALSILLLVGLIPLPATIGLFVLYLSIDTIGQVFYSFQWDALLLETGFAAILPAPWGLKPSYSTPVPRMTLWVFRLLIFRLMLESGAVKLLSGDPTWRNLTALNYHYETQPLPTPVAWYADQLPLFFQKLSVIGVFVVELLAPWFFFTKRRMRIIAALATIVLQLLIAITGNYTFFKRAHDSPVRFPL